LTYCASMALSVLLTMFNDIPHLKFRLKSPSGNRNASIELSGKDIHAIDDLSVFYKSLGYTQDMALEGTLPEEFVWDTYFRHCVKICNSCYQLNLINYLATYSDSFKAKYKEQIQTWLAHHSEQELDCQNSNCPAYANRIQLVMTNH